MAAVASQLLEAHRGGREGSGVEQNGSGEWCGEQWGWRQALIAAERSMVEVVHDGSRARHWRAGRWSNGRESR